MQIIFVTGSAGSGISLAAAATAFEARRRGQRVLLASLGPAHQIATLLNTALSGAPASIEPGLDAFELDLSSEVATIWQQFRGQMTGSAAALNADELPLVPGIDAFLLLQRLIALQSNGYDLAVIDAGPHGALIQALAVPDSFRWLVRLMLGLDRGPGQSNASLTRAMVPVGLLPLDLFGPVQQARVLFEEMRERALDPARCTARFVLRPDQPALEEARVGVAALLLHGLPVDGLLVGPLLPESTEPTLQAVQQIERGVLQQVASTWASRPVLQLPLHAGQVDQLRALGESVYRGQELLRLSEHGAPIRQEYGGQAALAVQLPALPRTALGLTISGEELIIRAGPYRRHLLMPAALRGYSDIKASRDGEWLLVRRRSATS